ncbi:MAG: SLBB domain-containing protein [Leptolyngbya sp. BL-A-14]
MRGSQPKLIVLMAVPLLGICHAEVVLGKPTMPNRPVVPAIPKPALAPPFPRVQPSLPAVPQVELPVKATTPASGVKPQPTTSSLQAEPYRLTAGDRFAVTIANIPEFSGQYQVQVDGTVNFPSLGGISIWGLTVHQIAELLTARYVQAEILRDPDITVGLLTVSPLKVALSGEVNRPGSYDLASADGKLPTLTTAIQKAGGITGLADLRKIKLLRARRSSADETFQVDLWELLQSGDLRQDITLRDGDSIIVATATTPIDPTEAGLIGAATVSPAFMQVGVLGETRQSGVVQVPPNTPLNQVLLAAGGFNSRARKGSVELIRLNRDGTVVRRKIRVDFSSGINEATNPVLRNRDVVLVGRNFIAALSDNLTAILGPVNQAVSGLTLFKSLFPASSGSGSTVIIPASGGTTTTIPTTTAPATTTPTATTP